MRKEERPPEKKRQRQRNKKSVLFGLPRKQNPIQKRTGRRFHFHSLSAFLGWKEKMAVLLRREKRGEDKTKKTGEEGDDEKEKREGNQKNKTKRSRKGESEGSNVFCTPFSFLPSW